MFPLPSVSCLLCVCVTAGPWLAGLVRPPPLLSTPVLNHSIKAQLLPQAQAFHPVIVESSVHSRNDRDFCSKTQGVFACFSCLFFYSSLTPVCALSVCLPSVLWILIPPQPVHSLFIPFVWVSGRLVCYTFFEYSLNFCLCHSTPVSMF